MKVLVLVLFAASLVAAIPKDDGLRNKFIAFQHKYGKIYSHDEFGVRFRAFEQNLQIVEKLNAEAGSITYGITKFMDLTPAEFKAKYLMKKPVDTSAIRATKPFTPINLSKATIPASFDWRNQGNYITPVYNQGQCGSCWAFSITENIESMWAIAGNTLTQLSMQQVVSCDTSDGGCGGGDPPTAYAYVESAGGLEPYSDYPYTGENGYCQFNAADVLAKISGWNYATQSQDESQMAAFLVATGPLSVCVDAETWQYYTGGVVMAGSCGTSLDHCVMAVGYSTSSSTPYWIVRNSWGTDWGLNGYIYIEQGQNTCGIAQEATCSTI